MEKHQNKKAKELGNLEKVKIGYARVSSLDDRQKLGFSVQMEALQNCHNIYSEKQSGGNDRRPELAKAIKLAKELSSQGKQVFTAHLQIRPPNTQYEQARYPH